MFENIMSEERHSILEQLTRQSLLQSFYMAGGTAAALYLGHRYSEDLDFFTQQEFDPFQLAHKMGDMEGFVLTGQEPGTLHCFVKNVKVSFLYYPYPFLEQGMMYKNCMLASLTDIALMKMVALVQRGARKDFTDLYFLDKEKISFEEILSLYPAKYSVKTYQPLVLIKSLGYFADAEREEMPKMFRMVSWEDIKNYFLRRQKELAVKIINEKQNE